MVKVTTSSGFECSVSEKIGNDFRFVMTFAKLQSKDAAEQITAPVELVNLVLGKDGAEALYRHVAEEDGTVPTDRLMEELTEVIRAAGEKNKEIKN